MCKMRCFFWLFGNKLPSLGGVAQKKEEEDGGGSILSGILSLFGTNNDQAEGRAKKKTLAAQRKLQVSLHTALVTQCISGNRFVRNCQI